MPLPPSASKHRNTRGFAKAAARSQQSAQQFWVLPAAHRLIACGNSWVCGLPFLRVLPGGELRKLSFHRRQIAATSQNFNQQTNTNHTHGFSRFRWPNTIPLSAPEESSQFVDQSLRIYTNRLSFSVSQLTVVVPSDKTPLSTTSAPIPAHHVARGGPIQNLRSSLGVPTVLKKNHWLLRLKSCR